VSGTSPIRALSHLGRLEILAALFQEVVVPAAVVAELEQPRAVALQRGLQPIGVLGTLLRAKERGLLREISPLLDRPQKELGFFISKKLRDDTLKQAGEAE